MTSRSSPWRTIALPVEHGGWSFLIEPLILGLVVAPSPPGAWLAMGAVAAFLVRHPLKVVALDWRRGMRYPRTSLAERFLAGYAALVGLACLGLFAAGLVTAGGE